MVWNQKFTTQCLMQAGAGFAKTSPYYIVQQGKACWFLSFESLKDFNSNLGVTWFCHETIFYYVLPHVLHM